MTTRDDIAAALTDPNATPWEFPRAPLPDDPSMRAALIARRAGPPEDYPQGKIGALAEMLAPSTPLDYGLMLAGGPIGRAAGKGVQIGSIVGGAMLTSDEAQAGPASKALKAIAKKPITPGELAELGLYPTTTPQRIFKETKGGGYSVNLPSGVIPTEGLMMGRYKNTDPRNMVLSPEEFKQAHIRQQAATNAKALAEPGAHFGTWKDPDTGKIYLDVSQRFEPNQIRQATKFGEKTNQLAGWNVGASQSFPVGNWRGFVSSPEFHGRMGEMADTGRAYLNQFPTKEWWDIHGTPFERVYGEKNLPQVAGFSATTAPVSAPRENMQMMSEYMRRHLSGEPIVQPDFRIPETAMGPRRPGMRMSMETGRTPNLEKSARGDLDQLQRAKVSHEARAMMGDPNAVVLDRHWARLTEAPERGIYANPKEGVIDTNTRKTKQGDYDFVVAEVSKAAQRRNRDPRDFSADVWTGIRETIKNTSELFGTKFRGSAITGESKSYADIFDDLVTDKAKHMGISKGELDKRLRSGDADLLSTMLVSSPVLYGAYRQWEQSQDGGS